MPASWFKGVENLWHRSYALALAGQKKSILKQDQWYGSRALPMGISNRQPRDSGRVKLRNSRADDHTD
jgi:hypothetical protein